MQAVHTPEPAHHYVTLYVENGSHFIRCRCSWQTHIGTIEQLLEAGQIHLAQSSSLVCSLAEDLAVFTHDYLMDHGIDGQIRVDHEHDEIEPGEEQTLSIVVVKVISQGIPLEFRS